MIAHWKAYSLRLIPPWITSLSAGDHEWLAARFEEAGQLIHRYNRPDSPATLDDLDDALERWTRSAAPEREDPEFVIRALGTAFGGHLCDRWGFDWCVVADKYGTDYAIKGQPSDIVIGPLNVTAKRVEAGIERFFEQFARDAEDSLRDLRRGETKRWTRRRRKPDRSA